MREAALGGTPHPCPRRTHAAIAGVSVASAPLGRLLPQPGERRGRAGRDDTCGLIVVGVGSRSRLSEDLIHHPNALAVVRGELETLCKLFSAVRALEDDPGG